MIVIRTFVEGILSEVSTWGIANAGAITENVKFNKCVQINLVIEDNTSEERQVTKNTGGSVFHFIATTGDNSQNQINSILLSEKIVGITRLLTDRELDVLRELHSNRNTKIAACNLHISLRTFSNHRFNITKKLAMPALDAADFIFEYSNVELFRNMLK